MKILFCHTSPQVKELGAPKVLIELAEELQILGWDCTTVGPEEMAAEYLNGNGIGTPYSELLRHYLHQHAAEYDVVDYDHPYLPYPRSEFSRKTLFVARSVMLAHHVQATPIPHTRRVLPNIKRLLQRGRNQALPQDWVDRATCTIKEADLVNVCNDDEKTTLLQLGIPAEKVVVIPFGISRSRRALFDAVPSAPPCHRIVAFVGTFDYRKGAREFPDLVEIVSKQVPDVQFRLLGTKGLFQTAEEVLANFPRPMRSRIEVVTRFRADELPRLLSSCSLGVFPSYIEGFPFGVLEMLAASVPVIAYDVPGPRMMLPLEYLVPRGDVKAMSGKVVDLLNSSGVLTSARLQANQFSQKFHWSKTAQTTQETYNSATNGQPESRLHEGASVGEAGGAKTGSGTSTEDALGRDAKV